MRPVHTKDAQINITRESGGLGDVFWERDALSSRAQSVATLFQGLRRALCLPVSLKIQFLRSDSAVLKNFLTGKPACNNV